jgi:Na+-translocating ferredoxin:NAD+ oxidoreductase subunit E
MKKQVTLTKEFVKGVWEINPVLKQLLGLCPTLAVTVTLVNGIAMALATTFVLVFSTVLISFIKKADTFTGKNSIIYNCDSNICNNC